MQENGWKPRWFHREGENGTFLYLGGYWETRAQGRWDGCPDIFGEYQEGIVDPSDVSWFLVQVTIACSKASI